MLSVNNEALRYRVWSNADTPLLPAYRFKAARLLPTGVVIMRKVTALVLLSSTLGITGCAFGTRHAELSYPPMAAEGGGLIASAHAKANVPEESREIVVQVTDQRTSRERIGNVRNGFGIDTANVVTSDDIRLWVESALTVELANAGYTIVADGGRATSDDAIALYTEILEVYCDVYMTYGADVSLTVTLTVKDQQPFQRTYEGDGSVGVNWGATGKSYAESLSLALQDAIAKILADIAEFR